MAHCDSGEICILWAERYLKGSVTDCLSLGFGLISVFSWAIAEIPQIFTNFKNGSTEGVSLAFLMTWVVGDLFNLVGCLMEPATLPTQFYTALVYTITTVVLVWQTLYYDHIYKWLKARKANSFPEKQQDSASKDQSNNKITKPVNVPENIDYSGELAKKNDADNLKILSFGTPASSLPIPTSSPSHDRSTGKNLYYMSARSLASSHTPTMGSYLAPSSRGSARSGPSNILNQSSVDDEGLLANVDSTPKNSKTVLRSVAATALFVGGLNFFHVQAIPSFESAKIDSRAVVILTGRKILQEASTFAFRDSKIGEQSVSIAGTWLGWIMAAIYMGGRVPQIWKNVQRGTVEGLNPLMFLFALIGNAAYVGSIIVKTLEWKMLKPNMPWLVDAAVCVVLDFFILTQFLYYRTRKDDEHEDNINGDYEALKS